MADRPIIFSAPMVRALLEGRKTQTRRLVKPRGKRPSLFDGEWSDSYVLDPGNAEWRAKDLPAAVGDRLYVRENWNGAQYAIEDEGPNYTGTQPYAADFRGTPALKWKPSIHMPRTASRLTLTVSDVRVQRLQDLSEEDAVAEGVQPIGLGDGPNHFTVDCGFGSLNAPTAAETFKLLWNLLHGEGAWGANPWVVALTFSVQHGNIDRVARIAA